jgi:hypothetical protein
MIRASSGSSSVAPSEVPAREEAIKAIGTRSLAINIYIWLAYR